MLRVKILLFLFLFFAGAVSAQNIYSRVKINYNATDLPSILEAGVALDHAQFYERSIIAEISDWDINQLKNLGVSYEILIPDMAAFYASANAQKRDNFIDCNKFFWDTITVPQNFKLGTMGGFYKYAEMLEALDSMASKYPDLITVKSPISTFVTHQSRPIYWVKISDNPNTDESSSENQVLYDAIHHAREPQSMTQLIFFMWYLLENYDNNNQVKHIVDNLELFFVPCLNPDGYIYNETNSPSGGGMWRKNRKDNGDGSFGVDLNRNYSYNWGIDNIGSSPNTFSDVYRGPSPFSEPETQAMKYFCENHNFKISLNYHSYSNILIHPKDITDDLERYTNIAQELTFSNNYVYGTGEQTLGYSVNGDSDDWMYKDVSTKDKQYSFTPEVGNNADGFWPMTSRIVPLAQENLLANINTALIASEYVKISENSDFSSSQFDELDIDLKSFGFETPSGLTVNISVNNSAVNISTKTFTVAFINDMQTYNLKVPYFVSKSVLEGTYLEFKISVSGSRAEQSKIIKKVYSNQAPLANESFDDLSNWSSAAWNVTTEDFISSPNSMTDSPFGTYASNELNDLFYSQDIDLTNPKIKAAYLEYYAKWEIENGYDYVQVIAQDGATETALCGKYTTLGIGFTGQPDAMPLYDGTSDWVYEQVSLNDFLGQNINIIFRLTSDAFTEMDGFYIDDFKYFTIVEKLNSINDLEIVSPVSIFPNPNNGVFEIESAQFGQFKILNELGQTVRNFSINQSNKRVVVSGLESGIYFVVPIENQNQKVQKIVVLRK